MKARAKGHDCCIQYYRDRGSTMSIVSADRKYLEVHVANLIPMHGTIVILHW